MRPWYFTLVLVAGFAVIFLDWVGLQYDISWVDALNTGKSGMSIAPQLAIGSIGLLVLVLGLLGLISSTMPRRPNDRGNRPR